jgi:integrase
VLRLGVKFGWVMPQPTSNWLSEADLINLLELAGWEVIKRETQQLLPVHVPLLSTFCNRFLVRLPLLRHLGATIWLTARPRREVALDETPGCSVIVPARNEAGNIRAALERIPTLGRGTGRLTATPLPQANAWAMIQGRARAAGIRTRVGCHTFRATGITAYLKNGGTLEKAAAIAHHASTRTTQLYDRRDDAVNLDEVERILI